MDVCPIFDDVHLMGKKWTIEVIQEVISNGDKGFNFILKRLDNISPSVLSRRLKELEERNILAKEIISNTMPVKVSYKLTNKGSDLQRVISILRELETKYPVSSRSQ